MLTVEKQETPKILKTMKGLFQPKVESGKKAKPYFWLFSEDRTAGVVCICFSEILFIIL